MRLSNSLFESSGKVRPVKDVPAVIVYVLFFALFFQITIQINSSAVNPEIRPIPEAMSVDKLKLIGLADNIAMSKLTMLWLQAFDDQPGISIPFKQLNYSRIINWLNIILELDNRTLYPLLSASRIYSEVPDDNRKRMMLEFVYEKFLDDPNRRWPALAHAVYVAKHQLKDLPLALRYAKALAKYATSKNVPFWAKEMNIYVLEDMNEIESAKILIGGLIESGEITDEHELRFLKERLKRLEKSGQVQGK